MLRTRRRLVVVCALAVAALPLGLSAGSESNVERLLRTRECRECDLSNEKGLSGKDLSGVDLSGANLAGAMLYRANFTGANLSNTNFADANLTKATLTGATVAGANFAGADLNGAEGARLAGASTNEMTKCPSGTSGPCQ